ncbi:MAG: beta-galactosidase [Paludibacter sp.]|nr:beta-galactosidase [Paludibacter sp.]
MLKSLLKFAVFFMFFCVFSQNNIAQNAYPTITKSLENSKFIGSQKLYYGAAYYPEVWPESDIDNDIIRMKELKMNVMRIAEFSWSKMEPTEGKYDFLWLRHIIEKLHANGIDVILCTPTATPPVWLSQKHPEIYLVNELGIRLTQGARRNCSYTSKVYRKYCEKICLQMAKEFDNCPGVIGWQTDNEFSLSQDYSTETKQIWHKWLKNRYQTIENLNQLWCTDLWSQTYQTFEQILMPTSLVWNHPSLRFAWTNFTNDMIVEFQDVQIAALHKYSKLPITHDGMPSQAIDYEKLFKNLDFAAVNNYHSFEAYDLIQSNYDRMRGFHKGYHWLFETAPNYSGGGQTWYLHQIPGSMKAALWMNYGSGAQGSMFWLWRQHRSGQEMVHGSILSAWGAEVSNYQEIKEMGAEIEKASPFLMNNPVAKAEAAIIYSHKSQNGFKIEEYANGLKYYQDWSYRFYRAMADAYIFRDVIYPSADISSYKLLFIPLLPIINEQLQAKLKKWVEQGGTLILGPMTGYRNEEWSQYVNHFTGNIEDWTGIYTQSLIPIGTSLRAQEIPFMIDFKSELSIPTSESSLWSLALQSPKGNVIASYNGGAHDKKAAIIEHAVGKGTVVVLGTDPGKIAMKKILLHYAKKADISPLASGDESVVVVPRKGNETGWVIVNLSKEPRRITLNSSASQFISILKDSTVISKEFDLKPFEVQILREN